MNEKNNTQSICEINTTSSDTGNYSLYLNNSINKLNVINIYSINVTYMDKDCIYRNASNFTNFASVKFDHKIKYSDIINVSILLPNNEMLPLEKYSIQKSNDEYIVNFSLTKNLIKYTNGTFSIQLKDSPDWYNSSYNFTIDNKTMDVNSSIQFIDATSYKVIINGTYSKKNGSITLEFIGNITNYTINNMKSSIEGMIFNNCLNFIVNNDDYNISHYRCQVDSNQNGMSSIDFDLCGAHFKTSPIKFVLNVTADKETDYNFNLKFNKMLILIFLIIF